MLIYLAGPLDGISWEEGRSWYEEAAALAPSDVVLYCPGHAFMFQAADAMRMDMANRAVIAMVADAVLAKLDGPGKALGTCREIEFAKRLDKPVVAVGAPDSLLTYDLITVDSLEEGMEEIGRMAEVLQ